VVIGGLFTSTAPTLLVLPAISYLRMRQRSSRIGRNRVRPG